MLNYIYEKATYTSRASGSDSSFIYIFKDENISAKKTVDKHI